MLFKYRKGHDEVIVFEARVKSGNAWSEKYLY
jgi:hypothetical protein